MKKVAKLPESKKHKQKRSENVLNAFALIFLAGLFGWIVISFHNEATGEQRAKDQYLTSLPDARDTIRHDKVCMVDDFFQGDFVSVGVSINNKTYYGCSAKANRKLATTDSIRFSVDPVSKKRLIKPPL